MEIVKKAKALLSHKNYSEALKALRNEFVICPPTEKIEVLKLIVEIQETAGRESSFVVEVVQCLDLLSQENSFKEAYRYLEKIKDDISGKQLLLAWKVSFHNGEVEESKKFGFLYADFLISKKNTSKCLEFLNLLERSYGELKAIRVKKIHCLFLCGDNSTLLEELKIPEDESLLFSILIDESTHANFWKAHQQVGQIYLKELLGRREKKLFLNSLFSHLCYRNVDKQIYNYVFDFGSIYKRKKLLSIAIDYVKSKADLLESEKLLSAEELLTTLEDEEETTDIIDLASDLFEQDFNEAGLRVRQLERDIRFLEGKNQEHKVSLLINELKELDPSNELLKEYESSGSGSSFLQAGQSIDLVKSELLKEIRYFTNIDTDEGVDIADENRLAKWIDYLDKDKLISQYSDLVMTFLSLEMPSVSMYILEKTKESVSEEELLNYFYLKIEVLIGMRKNYLALDIVEDIISTFPLVDSERVCFYYLYGELLREVGRPKDSLLAYKEVIKIDRNYRLVKERIDSFG